MSGLDSHTARDFVQSRLLAAIFSHSLRNEVALKGGFAMRVLAGSVRYTKDLDLESCGSVPLKVIQSCIRKAVGDIKSTGFISDLTVSEPKQTETTQRWKIGGRVGDQDVRLTVEVSRRNQEHQAQVQQVEHDAGYGLGTALISCISLPSIAASKVDCLMNPNREAPRDIYDLYLLIKMDIRPSPEAIANYGVDRLAAMRDALWAKLDKMDFEAAKQSLLGFLPPSASQALTAEVWDEMRLVVDDKVRGWLDDAMRGGREAAEETDERDVDLAKATV